MLPWLHYLGYVCYQGYQYLLPRTSFLSFRLSGVSSWSHRCMTSPLTTRRAAGNRFKSMMLRTIQIFEEYRKKRASQIYAFNLSSSCRLLNLSGPADRHSFLGIFRAMLHRKQTLLQRCSGPMETRTTWIWGEILGEWKG